MEGFTPCLAGHTTHTQYWEYVNVKAGGGGGRKSKCVGWYDRDSPSMQNRHTALKSYMNVKIMPHASKACAYIGATRAHFVFNE